MALLRARLQLFPRIDAAPRCVRSQPPLYFPRTSCSHHSVLISSPDMTSAIHERSKVIAQLGADSDSAQRTIHANYKEQVFLQRRIFELERSEKTTARSFSVEQRVTFRRFNRKLTQSKLLHARLTGNRDLETVCRHRLFSSSFNSEMSRLEEAKDLDRMLTVYREERYPSPKSRCSTRMTSRTAPSRMVRTPTPVQSTLRAKSAVVAAAPKTDVNNNTNKEIRPRAKSACPSLLRIFIEVNETGADPAKALQTETTEIFPPQPSIDITHIPEVRQETTNKDHPDCQEGPPPPSPIPEIRAPTPTQDALVPSSDPEIRAPTPSSGTLLSPSPTGRRPSSRASSRPNSRAAGNSWLNDKPRITLREFNTVLMKVSNHDGRVKKFCDSLRGLERQVGPEESEGQITKSSEEQQKEALEKREIGDVSLRNMTFRNLQKPLFIYTHGVSNAKATTNRSIHPP